MFCEHIEGKGQAHRKRATPLYGVGQTIPCRLLPVNFSSTTRPSSSTLTPSHSESGADDPHLSLRFHSVPPVNSKRAISAARSVDAIAWGACHVCSEGQSCDTNRKMCRREAIVAAVAPHVGNTHFFPLFNTQGTAKGTAVHQYQPFWFSCRRYRHACSLHIAHKIRSQQMQQTTKVRKWRHSSNSRSKFAQGQSWQHSL